MPKLSLAKVKGLGLFRIIPGFFQSLMCLNNMQPVTTITTAFSTDKLIIILLEAGQLQSVRDTARPDPLTCSRWSPIHTKYLTSNLSPKINASNDVWSGKHKKRSWEMVDGSLEGKKENIKQEAGKFDKKKGKPGGMEENKSEGGKTAICNSFCSVCVCVCLCIKLHKLQYTCVCVCWLPVCAHPSMCQAWLATQCCASA